MKLWGTTGEMLPLDGVAVPAFPFHWWHRWTQGHLRRWQAGGEAAAQRVVVALSGPVALTDQLAQVIKEQTPYNFSFLN